MSPAGLLFLRLFYYLLLRINYTYNNRGFIKVRTHPTKGGHVTVPHPRKDMALPPLRSIERQCGLVIRR